MIFSLAGNIMSQKVDGNMIFSDYWKVVLIFLGMVYKVFLWAKKLIKRLYLLVTEKFLFCTKRSLFWTFWWWETRSFLNQKFYEKMIFTDYWIKNYCFKFFCDEKYGLFLSQKVDAKMMYTAYWKILVLYQEALSLKFFFFSQRVNGNMIFTWFFFNFPWFAKNVFSCSTWCNHQSVYKTYHWRYIYIQ